MAIGDPGSDTEDREILSRSAREPDRTWAYGPDRDQIADVYLPAEDGGRSTVVLVHGGFWRPDYDRVHQRPLAAFLADRGHLVISLEYRRVPGDPECTLADLRSAVATLRTQEWVPSAALQVIGHSAGGHLVLVLSADEGTPLQSVVALAPVADLELAYERELDGDAVAAFLGRTPDQRADLDPSRRGPSMIPVAIVHGDDDSLVPLEVTQSYLDRLPADQRPRLVTLPNTGHFELIDPAAPAMSAVLAALDELAAMRTDIG